MYTIHQTVIQEAWGNRVLLKDVDVQKSIRFIIDELDAGKLRVAEPGPDGWKVNDWIKKAVILYFPIRKMETIETPPFEFHDKIPLKSGYKAKGVRVVPHAIARHGSYISKGVILMPSYVNIGAYVDAQRK